MLHVSTVESHKEIVVAATMDTKLMNALPKMERNKR
jgi:hypothetical protein